MSSSTDGMIACCITCAGLIDHEHDATNALQDVWLNAFRGIRSLRDSSRLAPWLYTIARRTAMNHFRSKYARRETQTSEVIDE